MTSHCDEDPDENIDKISLVSLIELNLMYPFLTFLNLKNCYSLKKMIKNNSLLIIEEEVFFLRHK